jgi:nicotinate-nucleotide adenylyltransferase
MLKAMELDEVWYMVSPQNPWKQGASDLAPEQVRYEITKAALEGEEGLVASDYEFHLPRPSYTWNTLQHLEQDYPDHRFVLIIGGDNWDRFPNWAHAEEIMQRYQIAVFPRSNLQSSMGTWASRPRQCSIVNVPLIDITSTDIRRMLRNGEDASPFIPEKAAELILRHYIRKNI